MSASRSGYGRFLRGPGVARLTGAFIALGTSGTMAPVSLVLFARAATGSFAAASGVLAATTAGGLVLGPLRGRLVDRLGPSRAVLRLALPSVATDALFIVAGHSGFAVAALVGLGAIAGAISVPAGAALRTVWSQTLTDAEGRQAGYALMGVVQETNFILGPLLAGLLIALFSATAAVAGAAVLNLAGGLAFATWHSDRAGRLGRVRATFGLLDVAFPAFARGHSASAAAGILLSAFAAGSLAGGLLYGSRPWPGTAARRYPPLCLLATVGLAPLLLTPGLVLMAGLSVLAGLCFAPIGISQVAVIDEVTPAEHRAEAFTWLGAIYGGGLALGAAVAGQLVSASGVRAALALGVGTTALATPIVAGGMRRLAPENPE